MYKHNENGYIDGLNIFYDVGEIYEALALKSSDELKHYCERCMK